MNAAFAPRHVRTLGPRLIEITERLRARWLGAAARGEIVRAHDDLRCFAVDVTMIVAFGEDADTLRRGAQAGVRARLEVLFPAFHRRLRALWPYWRVFKLPRDRVVEAQAAALREELGQRIEATRRALAESPERAENPANLLEAMLVARDEDDPKLRLSDEEMFANAVTILLAGEDTTSNTAAWMLDAIARTPALAERLRAELDAELGEAPVVADLDCLERMPYLHGTVQEALRLRSPAPVMFLEALVDQRVGALDVPAGMSIVVLTRKHAISAAGFERPADFDPARWIEAERDPAARHDAKSMLSFGYGPRICPGRALALLELGLVGSMAVKNFELESVDADAPEELFGFTMSPRRVNLSLRTRA